MFSVLGMAGSLRRRSYNRALLRAAAKLAPAGVEVEVFELGELPLYNADLDETRGGGPYPQPVAALREKVIAADALLLAVPEYNWGPSGVIKNAVDWVSRPSGKSPLAYKPVALMGAAPGPAGTGRGQLQLRQNLLVDQLAHAAAPARASRRLQAALRRRPRADATRRHTTCSASCSPS